MMQQIKVILKTYLLGRIISFDSNIFPARIAVVIFFFIACYGAIIYRLFDVTLLNKNKLTNNTHFTGLANRADIVDVNGNLLAVNLATVSIYANAKQIENPEHVALKISQILSDVTYESLLTKLNSGKSFIWVKRNVNPKEHQEINNLGIPGVYYEISTKRAYPYDKLFAHVLGYVGLDGVGLAGVEKHYDDYLRSYDNLQENRKLKLTLDARIQNVVRAELLNAVAKFRAKGAAGILMDATNGRVLALVSVPDYDPHSPGKASSDEMFNKATLGLYELGSIFKAFTVAIGLDTGVTKFTDVYDVSKPIQFSRHVITDFRGKGGYLSVPEILMYSSNIGTVQVAIEIGKKRQIDYLKKLGFFDYVPVAITERAYPLYPKTDYWSDASSATISYGHGISVSPLHAISAFTSVVNGGYLCKPILVDDADNPMSCKQVFKEETSKEMRKVLNLVVTKGAGKKAGVEGYLVGGKSGTANKAVNGRYSKYARMSTFVSAFPIHDPKYSLIVVIDDPQPSKETYGFATGGWTSAPTSANIISRVVSILGIPPVYNQDVISGLELEYDTEHDPA